MTRWILPSLLATLACVPELPTSEPTPVDVVVDHDLQATETTRLGAWQVDLADMSKVAELHSAPLDDSGASFEVPWPDHEHDLDMGALNALSGHSVLLFVAAYDDEDDSGSHDPGEPVLGLSQTALIRVQEGAWYTLDFGPTLDPVFGETDDGIVLMDFTSPAGLSLGGGFDETMPPNEAVPLPPADMVSVLSPIEPEAYKAYIEAGHPSPPPLPGRPAEAAADLQDARWSLDLPAEPGPAFFGAHLMPLAGLGTVAIEAPVAFLDNGDQTFVPDFSGAPPVFDQTGTPERDLLLGQICVDESQVVALYVATPGTWDESLALWALFGGQTGWHPVIGLDRESPSPEVLSPKEARQLDFTTLSCAPDAE